MKNVLLIDPLAGDMYHLVDDDLYLTECLLPITSNLEVLSSETSIGNINAKFPGVGKPLRKHLWLKKISRLRSIARVMGISTRRVSDVIFQSFEELHIVAFKIFNPMTPVHLIVTNNLASERSERHPLIWKLQIWLALRLASSVIVHSEYERERVRTAAPFFDPGRIFIKPFHQVALERPRPEFGQRNNTIFFMGPVYDRKPIEPLLELIERDIEGRFDYVLRAVQGLPEDIKERLKSRSNVDLGEGYVADEDYYELFQTSALVLLTHTKLFEGKLSGPFSDSIASGVAVIAQDMSPHNEYFDRFGPMGFLVDYDQPEWVDRILNGDLSSLYPDFQRNMSKCRENSSLISNRAVFEAVLK